MERLAREPCIDGDQLLLYFFCPSMLGVLFAADRSHTACFTISSCAQRKGALFASVARKGDSMSVPRDYHDKSRIYTKQGLSTTIIAFLSCVG